MRLEHPEPFGGRWRASWIWEGWPRIVAETATRPVLEDPTDTVVLLRRSFDLAAVPATAPARLWVDGRYVLRVNGTEVARGPVRSDPRAAHYDLVDLVGHLVVGTNVIAITARHFGTATSWWTPVPPTYSLGAGSVVFEALVGDEWIVTDRTWTVRRGDAWSPVPVPGDVACLPLESFDARSAPTGWELPGYDDGDWSPATEIAAIHTGGTSDRRPPSEPFGMLRPPVRSAFPGGAAHRARLIASTAVAGGAPGEDPVRQVLADEATADRFDGDHPPTERPGADERDDRPDTADTADTADAADTADTADTPDTAEPAASTGGPVTIHAFDLGHIAAGTLTLEVRGAAAGTVVDVAAAEHLDDRGRLVTLGQHAGVRYVCDGSGLERFESLDVIGARHLHASVRPPTDAPPPGDAPTDDTAPTTDAPPTGGGPTVDVAIHDRHRPRPPGASFECSDPLLQRIHEVGLRTVDLCALDAYVDCPTREQRAWTGDSVVHQMVDLVSNPDWSMAIWHPQLAAEPRADGMLAMAPASDFAFDDRTMLPDWSLHWIRSVHNLHRYTGDRDLVAELLPVAERTLRWFEPYLDADGLLHDVSGWVLLDWSSVYSSGCSSTLNALWARALEDVAQMATWLGNDATAAWATRRRDGVRDAFDVFWDDDRGVYVDHLVDGIRARPAAQHPGAAALAAGLVPEHRQARVIERLTDRSSLVRHSFVMDPVTVTGGSTGYVHLVTGYPEPEWDVETQMVEAEPFFRYVVHDGLARAGRADLVADLCRDWQVFLDAGETTWPECWTGGTRCHGWSSTPTRDLIVHTLGITPAEPGYAAVRVAPALGDLEWARAVVPSPHGPITVEARADGTVEVDSPVPVVRG